MAVTTHQMRPDGIEKAASSADPTSSGAAGVADAAVGEAVGLALGVSGAAGVQPVARRSTYEQDASARASAPKIHHPESLSLHACSPAAAGRVNVKATATPKVRSVAEVGYSRARAKTQSLPG